MKKTAQIKLKFCNIHRKKIDKNLVNLPFGNTHKSQIKPKFSLVNLTFINTHKSQIKMFETIGVLMVFFILLGIGFAVYFSLQKVSYTKDVAQKRQLESFSLVQKMQYLPELECIFLSSTEENCYDEFKLNAFSELLTSNDAVKIDYATLFGFSTVNVHIIYPGQQTTLKIYDRKPEKYKQATRTYSPISIKNPLTESKSFAYINITSYT